MTASEAYSVAFVIPALAVFLLPLIPVAAWGVALIMAFVVRVVLGFVAVHSLASEMQAHFFYSYSIRKRLLATLPDDLRAVAGRIHAELMYFERLQVTKLSIMALIPFFILFSMTEITRRLYAHSKWEWVFYALSCGEDNSRPLLESQRAPRTSISVFAFLSLISLEAFLAVWYLKVLRDLRNHSLAQKEVEHGLCAFQTQF